MEKTSHLMGKLPSCMECRYFDSATDMISGQTQHICRLKPPQAFAAAGMTASGQAGWMSMTVWPNVKASDWCGEHSPRLQS